MTVAVIALGIDGVSWAMDFLRQVAAFGDLPLVMGLDQQAGRQAQQRGGVGEDPDDVGSAPNLLVHRANVLVDQTLRQWASGQSAQAVISSRASRSMVATAGSWGSSIRAIVST